MALQALWGAWGMQASEGGMSVQILIGAVAVPAPDFDRLRAERDASIERVAREMWIQLGGDPDKAPAFHCREHGSPCFCACPDGPCEHHFQG